MSVLRGLGAALILCVSLRYLREIVFFLVHAEAAEFAESKL
jgi:hypothetical protein